MSKTFDLSSYKLPLAPQYIISPLLLILVTVAIFLWDPTTRLIYDKSSIAQGEYWRLLSGNLLHTNYIHMLLNCAGILLIWFLHAEHYNWRSYFGFLLISSVGCGLGLYYFSELESYVGLSGALHGFFIYGAAKDIRAGIDYGKLLFIGVIAKVGYEMLIGPSENLQLWIDADVAVEAHFFGMLTGLLVAMPTLIQWLRHGSDKPEQTTNQDD